MDFTDADDINYARAFLFHMEREGGWGGMPDDPRGIIHIDTDHTFLDDLKMAFACSPTSIPGCITTLRRNPSIGACFSRGWILPYLRGITIPSYTKA